MRIAHVVTTGEFAGTERYALDVGGGLAARGHDVVVIGGAPDTMKGLLPQGVRWAPGATPREALRTLSSYGRLDVVHSHITRADFVALAGTPWSRGAIRVSTRHITAARGYARPAKIAALAVRRALDVEIAVSSFTAEALPEGRPDEVLLNGVDSAPDGPDHRSRTVLVAQRLSPEKDTRVALEAFGLSGLVDLGWRLQIAGRGVELEALTEAAAALGLTDHVDFLGWVDDVDALYRRAGILLAPAPAEPCGLTVLEAAARALPIVAAGAAGHLETIGSLADAALFVPGDPASAAASLRQLADDERARSSYGEELRALQRSRFTIEHHVEELESIYFRALIAKGKR